ncbi:MAG: flagellar biosynthesis protein FlhB, partial [Rickettsiales bacterium]|nr:flagellar biosynthesis protein FlhB [Rickettsiales bacterium]
ARIREVAEKNDVPIVRNPPLARLLHAEADMDAEIPLTYYKAVAEVIGYVYKLQGYDPSAAMNTKPK